MFTSHPGNALTSSVAKGDLTGSIEQLSLCHTSWGLTIEITRSAICRECDIRITSHCSKAQALIVCWCNAAINELII